VEHLFLGVALDEGLHDSANDGGPCSDVGHTSRRDCISVRDDVRVSSKMADIARKCTGAQKEPRAREVRARG
jgi:hypothetical protein